MQKRVWKEIANSFHEKGYNITDDQCCTKWKNLKQKYRNVRDSNKETGRSATTWEYFDMIDEFLNTRPEVSPLSIASSCMDLAEEKEVLTHLPTKPTMKITLQY